MLVNSSSSPNTSIPSSPPFSTNIYYELQKCLSSRVGTLSITTFTITTILFLLPLCLLILYLGVQQWRQQGSSMTMSHSDIFTYNMVVTELFNVVGSSLVCYGVHTELTQMVMVGIYLLAINLSAQMFFHILTCVERYLAVVHPITYLSLRKAKGIRIRNVTIGCVWLLCFAGTGFMSVANDVSIDVMSYCFSTFALTVISFCSHSVLCVLIRPGPGDGGERRQQIDQSKLRAFYTIMVILGVLLFRFVGNVLSRVLSVSPELGETERCAMWVGSFWFGLPSSLVLPLLFLQRARKLLCCKNNTEQR